MEHIILPKRPGPVSSDRVDNKRDIRVPCPTIRLHQSIDDDENAVLKLGLPHYRNMA